MECQGLAIESHDGFYKCVCKLMVFYSEENRRCRKKNRCQGETWESVAASRTQLLDMTLDCNTNGSPADVVNYV